MAKKEASEEYPMGVARPASEDPSFHVEAWPEAYDPQEAEGEAPAPTKHSGSASSSKDV
jgi:hypothetical protein